MFDLRLFLWPGLSDVLRVMMPLVKDACVATVGNGRRREVPFVVMQVHRLVSCVLGNL